MQTRICASVSVIATLGNILQLRSGLMYASIVPWLQNSQRPDVQRREMVQAWLCFPVQGLSTPPSLGRIYAFLATHIAVAPGMAVEDIFQSD